MLGQRVKFFVFQTNDPPEFPLPPPINWFRAHQSRGIVMDARVIRRGRRGYRDIRTGPHNIDL